MTDLEEILVEKAKAGDLKSFEILVSRYQKKVFGFIYRMVLSVEDARDLTQEVFLSVFRSLGKFRGDAKFSSWLYRIASNKSLDFLKKNRKLQVIDEEIIATSESPEQVFLQQDKIRHLRSIIARLPDKYRLVLILFHYENFTYRQIANTLDIPEKTVATRIYRAKLILKERLGGEKDGTV